MPRKWSPSLLLSLVICLMLVAAPRAAAAEWDGPVTLDAVGGNASVAIGDDGSAVTVWHNGVSQELYGVHRPAGGSWTERTTVFDGYVGAVSVNGNAGRFVAAFRNYEDLGGTIRARVYALEFDAQAGWGAPQIVHEHLEPDDSDGNQTTISSEPRVVVDDGGTATIMFPEVEQQNYAFVRSTMYAARWAPNGAVGSLIPLAEEPTAAIWDFVAAVEPDGQATAAWRISSSDDHRECSVRAATLSVGGWSAIHSFFSTVPASTGQCDTGYQLVAGPGGITAVWNREGLVHAARRASGGLWGGTASLDASFHRYGLGRAADGSTLLVGSEWCGGYPRPVCPMRAVRLPAEGPWGPVEAVAPDYTDAWDRSTPAVAFDDATGTVAAAWVDCLSDCALASADRDVDGTWSLASPLPVEWVSSARLGGNRSGEIATAMGMSESIQAAVRLPGPADACGVTGSRATASASTTASTMPTEPPKIGNWWFGGCFTKTGEHTYETSKKVELNGLGIELDGAGTIVVDTQAMTVTATAPVRVTAGPVTVAGRELGPFVLYQGALNWSLSASQIEAALPAEAKLLGLAIASSQALLHATAGGEVAIGFDVTLPEVLGGGTAQSALTASWVSGLRADSLKVTGASAAVGELFRLSDVTLDYASGEAWSLSGDIAAGTGLTGRFAYSDGSLTAGAIDVERVPLGGLAELTDVHLEMAPLNGGGRRWSGSARQGANTLAADLSYDASGNLTAATLDASELDLFGALTVRPLRIAYAAGAWSATASAVVPGSDPAAAKLALAFDKGLLTKGELTVSDAAVASVARIQNLDLSYAYDAATKATSWTGSTRLMLNGPSRSRVDASFAAANGRLSKLAVAADPIDPVVPLGPGVGLTAAGFELNLAPPKLAGRLAIAAGPPVLGKPALRADGQLTYLFPSDDPNSNVYDVAATVKLVNQDLVQAHVRYAARTGRTEFSGRLGSAQGWTLGPVRVGATLEGWAERTGFLAKGSGELSVLQYAGAAGSIAANPTGIAGCGALKAGWQWSGGFTYAWGGELETFGGACDLSKWQNAATPAAARSLDPVTFDVPAGSLVQALRFRGDGGPPNVTLTDPNGVEYTTPAEPGVQDTHAVLQDQTATIFLIDQPASGTWTVEHGAGPAVSGFDRADPLPPVSVSGSVSGAGSARSLTYSATAIDGQQITFVEHGGAAPRALGAVAGGDGSLTFNPGPGSAGARTITAEVTQYGFHRASVDVASFDAPAGESLTVAVTGSGTVESTASAPCTTLCETIVTPGAVVTLTPVPADGFRFAGWRDACSGTGTCTLSLDAPAAVTAVFEPLPPAEPAVPDGGGVQPAPVQPDPAPPVPVDPPQPPLPPRGAGPTPRLRAPAGKLLQRGRLVFSAECRTACRLTTRGSSLRIGRRSLRLTTATKTLSRRGRVTFRIRLSAKQRRLIRRGRRAVRIVLTAYYADERIGGPLIRTVKLPRRRS